MDDLLTLKNGPTVRSSAVALSVDLERRGHFLLAEGGALKVGNGGRLTAEDCAAILREKLQLIAICDYVASGACDADRE